MEKRRNCKNSIILEGAHNVRDLGGYRAGEKTTQPRRFIRGASLSGLTPADQSVLLELGLDCIVDLRSRVEVQRAPDPLVEQGAVAYHHVPMLDYIQSNIAEDMASFPSSMEEMYIGLLDNSQQQFRQVFQVFAEPQYRTILFHCTAGKDRTGVTAMLLLLLMGVEAQVVVEDYAWSEELLYPMAKPDAGILPAYLFSSAPAILEAAVQHLTEVYGGAAEYLQKAGVTAEQREAIRAKFLG